MAIEPLEMSRVQQDLCTATKMFHDSTLLYLLLCMVTVHLTQRAKYFGFFARATNEPTFCLTTGTVFIFLTMPSADENHDVQIISKEVLQP